jgi:hypothetical protein
MIIIHLDIISVNLLVLNFVNILKQPKEIVEQAEKPVLKNARNKK